MSFLEKEISALSLSGFSESELFPTNVALSSERVFYDVENSLNSCVERCDLGDLRKNEKSRRKNRKKSAIQFLSHKKNVWNAQELVRARVLKKFKKTLDSTHFFLLSTLLLRYKDVSEVHSLLDNDKMMKSPKKSFSALQELIEYENTLILQDKKQKKDNVDKALQLMDYSRVENQLKTYEMDLILGLTKETIETRKNIMDHVLGLNKVSEIVSISK